MYKQRHENSNLPATEKINYDYTCYIASREGTSISPGYNHGLFGRLQQGDKVQPFENYHQIANLVAEKTRERTTIFRGFISLKEDSAKEAGLTTLPQWTAYLEKHIFTIAEKNKIPQKNLQWVAAFHDKKGQPHAHIIFWDKDPSINKSFVHSSIPNSIRLQLIKDTFGDRIFELGQTKNALTKKIRQSGVELKEELTSAVGLLGKKRYEMIRGVYREGLKGQYMYTGNVLLLTLAPKLFSLKEQIPKNGSLKYQLLPHETKSVVDELVQFILAESPEISDTVRDYVETRCQQAQIYGTVTPEKQASYQLEAEKLIANAVMNMVRVLNQLDWEYQKEAFTLEEQSFFAEQLLESLKEVFQEEKQPPVHGAKLHRFRDMSAAAKKEYALKQQDKGFDH